MTTNDEIRKKYEPLFIDFEKRQKQLNEMLNEARADTVTKLKSQFRQIMHAFAYDPDKSFKHIDEILKTIKSE
jgi:hypothetical protein